MAGMIGALVLTGAALLGDCQAKGARRDRCEAYVHGVIDATTTLAQSAGEAMLCIPPTATTGQVVDTVTRYIAAAPNEAHMTASSLSLYALQLAYPCPN